MVSTNLRLAGYQAVRRCIKLSVVMGSCYLDLLADIVPIQIAGSFNTPTKASSSLQSFFSRGVGTR